VKRLRIMSEDVSRSKQSVCYCQNSTVVVFSREEVREYHPIWTTPHGVARLRVGCEFHSWWYFKLNIPPKNCRGKARATPPKFHSCYDSKKRSRAYVQSSPDYLSAQLPPQKVTTHHDGVIGIGRGAASAR